MNLTYLSTLSALKTRFRVLLGFVLLLIVAGGNYLLSAVDIDGWSSGFTHPLHGGDHFLAMLAVGVWAAQLRGKAIWLLPLTFVGVMSLGGIAGAAGLSIAGAEILILLSCLVFSLLIIRKIRFSNHINVIIVAFFAFFHGFAHGQEISTSASLISYTLGFMLATLLLHGAGILIVRLLVIVFALFISHIVYAQAAANQVSPCYKTTSSAQTEFFIADQHIVPPDKLRWTTELRSQVRDNLPLLQGIPKQVLEFPAMRISCHIVAKWLNADWLDNQRLNIDFLTGVGKTSPPVANVFDITPRFTAISSATSSKKISETVLRFALVILFTSVIRFLSNGVGATSPPVWRFALPSSLLRFIRLQLFASHTLSPRNPLITCPRVHSRAPPLVRLSAF